MANRNKKSVGTVERLMNEHVRMLGFPSIIVTRAFLYQWLKDHGWNNDRPKHHNTGYCFQSLDYAAFGCSAVDAPLTDEGTRDHLLEMMAQAMEREAA